MSDLSNHVSLRTSSDSVLTFPDAPQSPRDAALSEAPSIAESNGTELSSREVSVSVVPPAPTLTLEESRQILAGFQSFFDGITHPHHTSQYREAMAKFANAFMTVRTSNYNPDLKPELQALEAQVCTAWIDGFAKGDFSYRGIIEDVFTANGTKVKFVNIWDAWRYILAASEDYKQLLEKANIPVKRMEFEQLAQDSSVLHPAGTCLAQLLNDPAAETEAKLIPAEIRSNPQALLAAGIIPYQLTQDPKELYAAYQVDWDAFKRPRLPVNPLHKTDEYVSQLRALVLEGLFRMTADWKSSEDALRDMIGFFRLQMSFGVCVQGMIKAAMRISSVEPLKVCSEFLSGIQRNAGDLGLSLTEESFSIAHLPDLRFLSANLLNEQLVPVSWMLIALSGSVYDSQGRFLERPPEASLELALKFADTFDLMHATLKTDKLDALQREGISEHVQHAVERLHRLMQEVWDNYIVSTAGTIEPIVQCYTALLDASKTLLSYGHFEFARGQLLEIAQYLACSSVAPKVPQHTQSAFDVLEYVKVACEQWNKALNQYVDVVGIQVLQKMVAAIDLGNQRLKAAEEQQQVAADRIGELTMMIEELELQKALNATNLN